MPVILVQLVNSVQNKNISNLTKLRHMLQTRTPQGQDFHRWNAVSSTFLSNARKHEAPKWLVQPVEAFTLPTSGDAKPPHKPDQRSISQISREETQPQTERSELRPNSSKLFKAKLDHGCTSTVLAKFVSHSDESSSLELTRRWLTFNFYPSSTLFLIGVQSCSARLILWECWF